MDLNRAMIIGNVTRDPELRTTATGQNVCSFGIATNQQWTDAQGQKQQRAEYHNIVAWGKLAEICGQYLGKGRKVYIEGRLQTREWETPDAQKRQRTEIVADNMILLDRKDMGGASRPAAVPAAPTEPTVTPIDKSIGDNEIRLEDIPF
jgi:single-strand DNA-binding protein